MPRLYSAAMTDRPRTAIYAGSFDPPTLGHLALIRRALRLADRLILGVGINPRKRTWFDAAERIKMLQQACAEADLAVEVTSFEGLVVEFARAQGASLMIRGVRGAADVAFEQQNALCNQALAPEVETVLLFAEPDTAFISSTMAREVAISGGDASPWLPKCIAEPVAERARRGV